MINKMVDGGYLSWAHGAVGYKSWVSVRRNYTRQAGVLVLLDSQQSDRKAFYPEYKAHRKEQRAKREWIHKKVQDFQAYLREDPSLWTIEVEGLEADDLIALIAPLLKVPLIGTDKDLLQIPGLQIEHLNGWPVTINDFARKLPGHLLVSHPEEILLVLTLMGDKSDDIPRLIPPRQLDLMAMILNSPDPWQAAIEILDREAVLRNLSLAVLPSPWCYNPIPTPQEVFDLVRAGDWPMGVLRYTVTQRIEEVLNGTIPVGTDRGHQGRPQALAGREEEASQTSPAQGSADW